MSDYNNRFSLKPFNNRGSSNRFGGGDKEMYSAECASCHNKCEVPFRPNGKKPVYCSNCFVKDGESAPRGDRRDFSSRPTPSYERPAAARPDNSSYELKRELQAVNEKLERFINIMEGAVRVEEEMVTPAPTKAAASAPKSAAKPAPKPAKPPKKAGKKR